MLKRIDGKGRGESAAVIDDSLLEHQHGRSKLSHLEGALTAYRRTWLTGLPNGKCEVRLDMDSALVTGMAAVLGSLAGAAASIATTWMTQRSQKIREQAQLELRRRETLYGEFITEVSRMTGDAFGHSLERPENFANVYGLFARMHLVASAPVMKAAEECCRYLIDLYSTNMTQEQVITTLRESSAHPLTAFGAACRAELDQYVSQ